MATRKKTGGRKAGTPNKKTQLVEEILNTIGCNPLENLARIANGESMRSLISLNKDNGEYVVDDVPPTLEQRLTANKELCQYLYPKRKAIDHGVQGEGKVSFVIEG